MNASTLVSGVKELTGSRSRRRKKPGVGLRTKGSGIRIQRASWIKEMRKRCGNRGASIGRLAIEGSRN